MSDKPSRQRSKHRIQVGLNPETYEVVMRLAKVLGRPASQMISEMLDEQVPAFRELLPRLEKVKQAEEAAQEEADQLRQVLNEEERRLLEAMKETEKRLSDLSSEASDGPSTPPDGSEEGPPSDTP